MTNDVRRTRWLIAATVAMAIVAGGLALGSNMGFKINKPLTPFVAASAPVGDNWITLPYNVPYVKAQDVCDQLGLAPGDTVFRRNAATGTSQLRTCGPGIFGNYVLVPGEAVRVRPAAAAGPWLPSHY